MENSHPLARAIADAGVKYRAATLGRPKHKLGPPHPHAFLAATDVITKDKDLTDEKKRVILKLLDETKSADDMSTVITVFKGRTTFNKAQFLLTVAIRPAGEAAWEVIKEYLLKVVKAEAKYSAAPATGLERAIQAGLDANPNSSSSSSSSSSTR
jgi:hypothetical protein